MFTRSQFQNVARFQKSVLLVWTAIAFLLSSSAIAGETTSDADAVPEAILNLDLCTLSYQLYHQSLCLPLDPWYDVMSRIGSDRRDNICRFTHDYAATLGSTTSNNSAPDQGFYSGPNAARGWTNSNLNLDPILTNYKHIDAQLPAFTRDGERFLALVAPPYVIKGIKTIDCVRYRNKPISLPNDDCELVRIHEYPSGEDRLIVFEGGTGIAGNTDPSWSLMGFVLMRKTKTGYDAHIVFRGSRSGAALSKTVWRAQNIVGEHKGNPDWITDLRGAKQITQPLISKVGTVTEGFAESLPTMLGPIAASCKYLEQNYPAPEHIFVTGHSLGAGLASQFASAVLQGGFGDKLKSEVKAWPWNNIKLIAFAQPIPGDSTWAAQFDKISPSSMHYWVEGDSVVEATSNSIVGLFIDKGEHAGVQKKLSKIANCNDNAHEVFVIRASLMKDLAAADSSLSQLSRENTWAYYGSFSKMLSGQQESYVYPGAQTPAIVTEGNVQKTLENCDFASEFDRWLEQVYARMIVDKSSYIGPKFQSTLDERRKLVLGVAEWMRKPALNNNVEELDDLENEFSLIDGNLGLTEEEQWIYSGMVLSRIQKSNLLLKDLISRPKIKTCLDSTDN